MTEAQIYVLPAWTNPFLLDDDEPRLGPWVSPGRVSLAPTLSAWDRLTWGAVVFAVCHPGRPDCRLTWRDRLLYYLAAESAAAWPLPDDPLDSTEWIRRERLRPIGELTRGILDDAALRLRVRR